MIAAVEDVRRTRFTLCLGIVRSIERVNNQPTGHWQLVARSSLDAPMRLDALQHAKCTVHSRLDDLVRVLSSEVEWRGGMMHAVDVVE